MSGPNDKPDNEKPNQQSQRVAELMKETHRVLNALSPERRMRVLQLAKKLALKKASGQQLRPPPKLGPRSSSKPKPKKA